jgi:hypothetical protein
MDKDKSNKRKGVGYAGVVSAIELRKAAFSLHTGSFEKLLISNIKTEEKYEVDTPLGKRFVQLVEDKGQIKFIPMAFPFFRKRNPGVWEHDFGTCEVNLKDFFRVGGWDKIVLMVFDLKVKYFEYKFPKSLDDEMIPQRVEKSSIGPECLIISKGNVPNERADKFPNNYGGGNIFLGGYVRDYISRNGSMLQGMPDQIKLLIVLADLQVLRFKAGDEHRAKGEVEQLILGGTSALKWPVEMVENDIVEILMRHYECLPGIAARYFTNYDMMSYISMAQSHLGIMMNESEKIHSDFGNYRIGSKSGLSFSSLWIEVTERTSRNLRTYVTDVSTLATLQSEVMRRENCFLTILPRFHYVEREYAKRVV